MDTTARLDLLKAFGGRVRTDPSTASHIAGLIARHGLLTESGPGLAPSHKTRAADAIDAYFTMLLAALSDEQA